MEKYGEDGDTLKLKESGEEIKISELYKGEIAQTGSYTENKEKIAQLENQVEELKKALEESSKTEGEKAQELTELKTLLAETTVTEERMLQGYTAYINGEMLTGTMPNREAVSQTLAAGESYIVPEGYHNGSGKITAKDLASQTVATAAANDILTGKTAWVNGNLITGTGKQLGDYQIRISYYVICWNSTALEQGTYVRLELLRGGNVVSTLYNRAIGRETHPFTDSKVIQLK